MHNAPSPHFDLVQSLPPIFSVLLIVEVTHIFLPFPLLPPPLPSLSTPPFPLLSSLPSPPLPSLSSPPLPIFLHSYNPLHLRSITRAYSKQSDCIILWDIMGLEVTASAKGQNRNGTQARYTPPTRTPHHHHHTLLVGAHSALVLLEFESSTS